MTLYRDDGVVLRTQKLGEADRIVTLLTRRHGRVRAVAKGVRRTKSKFGGRLEPFTHVDLQLYQGRELDIATQAEAITSYGAGIADDYIRYTSGVAMLEMTERLTEEREPAMRMFLLLVGGLKALAAAEHDPGLVLDAFLLRALAVSGYEPSLGLCARCGMAGPHRWFAVSAGGSVCNDCRPAGSATIREETVALLSALLTGGWETADESDARARREATGAVSAYLQWHLERSLRALPLVERT
ncbi:MAG: repair protein RecO [Frankiales bacterium]|nr:repair protein RecO [Frankiales bacterium]